MAALPAIGLLGTSPNISFVKPPRLEGGPYVGGRAIVFNCSVQYFETWTDTQSANLSDSSSQTPETPPAQLHMLNDPVDDFLRASLVLPTTGYSVGPPTEYSLDYTPTVEFHLGINRQNRSASELWLSAYIGNYMGNCLSFLNDFLRQIEIEPEEHGTITKLSVRWERVAVTLGGLAVFQVICGLAALLYYRRNFEIIDDVSTISSMFTGLPIEPQEKGRQDSEVYRGKFVAEGDGFRWVLELGVGKNIKGA